MRSLQGLSRLRLPDHSASLVEIRFPLRLACCRICCPPYSAAVLSTPVLPIAGAGASGELLTTAQWIRHFVYQHEDYKRDSLVSEAITYDLVKVAEGIGNGTVNAPGPVFFFFFFFSVDDTKSTLMSAFTIRSFVSDTPASPPFTSLPRLPLL